MQKCSHHFPIHASKHVKLTARFASLCVRMHATCTIHACVNACTHTLCMLGHRERDGLKCQYGSQMMVSNKDAGTIIGRGGATIASLQNKSGTRIRVSNANDYFPGTQVCKGEGAGRCVLCGLVSLWYMPYANTVTCSHAQERVVLLAGATPQVVSGCTAILHELFRDSES